MSRTLIACGLAGLFAVGALAQTPVAADGLPGSSIEGRVLNDRTGLPLRDARVVLQAAKAGAIARIGVDTDSNGIFAIRDVEPGRYSLSAGRDGYLPSSVALMGEARLPQTFSIGAK